MNPRASRSLSAAFCCAVLVSVAACSSDDSNEPGEDGTGVEEGGDGAEDLNGAEQLAADLAESLSTHNLEGVPLTDPAAAEAFEELAAPLSSYDVEVTAGELTEVEGNRTAELAWAWAIEGNEWEYTTEVTLVQGEESVWEVDWSGASFAPDLADGDQIQVSRQLPPRGEVLGADGEVIVTERDVQHHGLDKSRIEADEVRERAVEVAEAVGIDPEPFADAAEAAGDEAFVEAITLRPADAEDRVSSDFADIPGALVVEDTRHLAPTAAFGREILGTVGPATAEVVENSDGAILAGDEVGLSGLQARYDDQLRGTPGIEILAVPEEPEAEGEDAAATTGPAEEPPESRSLVAWAGEPGEALQLTLDIDLQQRAEGVLADASEADPDAPASAIVAIRPSTGEIVAAANGPTNGGLNAATNGQYAPGSTFKMVTALALLRAGVGPDDLLSCTDTITVDGREFKNDDNYPVEATGDLTLRDAIAHSCNTALIGARDSLGDDDLRLAAEALGVGVDHADDLGFDAYSGQVPDPEGQTEEAAAMIGQGRVLASPLAMAGVAASIQEGEVVVPHLIEGQTASSDPEQPLTDEEAETLRDFMRAAVTEGSASFLADRDGPDVGAKTGTAEFGEANEEGRYHAHGWMIATQDDLAVAVFVETGASGAESAGPLLEAFLD